MDDAKVRKERYTKKPYLGLAHAFQQIYDNDVHYKQPRSFHDVLVNLRKFGSLSLYSCNTTPRDTQNALPLLKITPLISVYGSEIILQNPYKDTIHLAYKYLTQHDKKCRENIDIMVRILQSHKNPKFLALLDHTIPESFAVYIKLLCAVKYVELTKTIQGHDGPIEALTYFNKSSFITGSSDRTIKCWNLHNLTCCTILKRHNCSVNSLIPLNENLIALDAFQNLKINNIALDKCHALLQGHSKNINSIIKIDDNTLATCDHDGDIYIWNLDTNAIKKTFNSGFSIDYGLCLDPTTLAFFSEKKIFLLNFSKAKPFIFTFHNRSYIRCLQAWDKRTLTFNSFKNVKVLDILTKTIQTLKGHTGYVTLLTKYKNTILISYCTRGEVYFWHKHTGQCIAYYQTLYKDQTAITQLLVINNNLITTHADGLIRKWSIPTLITFQEMEEP